MENGHLYEITLGTHSDKYMVVGHDNKGSAHLRRVRTPKSKIDAVRLPNIISITYLGSMATNPKLNELSK